MSLLCVGFLMFATAPAAEAGHPFAGGAGTDVSPYEIANIDQLQAVGESVYLSKHFKLMNDIPAADTLGWNWSVAEGVYAGFDPIGDSATKFTGHFDGDGKVITDLHIDRPGENFVGLFGCVGTNGTITKVGVEGGSITGNWHVGGLVGENDGGTITNSYATGDVSGTGNYVGGLVGLNIGTITNSYATGAVEGTDRVGGLVGVNSGTIENSYATGAVEGTDRVGGLVGVNSGTINHSFWDTQTTELTTGVGDGTSDGANGKTTAEMQQRSTFDSLWNYGTVWAQVYVTGVTLDPATLDLTVGATGNLTATVVPPEDITYPYLQWQGTTNLPVVATGKNVTWTSDKPDIAAVNENGLVTAVSAGTAIITVTTNCESKTHTSTVDVTADTTAPAFASAATNAAGTEVTITMDETLANANATPADFEVKVGGTAQAVPTAAIVAGTEVTLTLAAAVAVGDVVTVSYTKATPTTGDSLQDAAGNYTATFTNQPVTNATVGPGAPGGGGGRDDDPAPDKEEVYEDVGDGVKEQLEDAEIGAELQIEVGAEDLPPALDYETVQGLVENQNDLSVAFEEAKVDLHFTPEALWTDELQAAGAGTLVGLSAAILEGEDARAAANFAVGIGGEVLRAYDLSVTVIADTGDEEGTKVHQLNGAVTVTLDLSDLDLTAVDTNQLTIQHQQPDGTWLELKSTFDPETKTLTFTTDRFSMFAVVEKPAAPGTITLTIGQTAADVYGTPYILDAVPYIQAGTGRTMIPLRFVSEALGAEVDWQAETRQVLIKDGATEITLTIDSDQVLVNGTPATLDCRAELKPPGRTFVPLRFISETLGAQVDYDEQTRQITITRTTE